MTSELATIAANAVPSGPGVPAGTDVTHVILILDRSGSMQGKEADVIGGVNAYVGGLDRSKGSVGISYVRFDQEIELVWNDVALDDVPTMTLEHYQPRGTTALLDAVGMTVSSVAANGDHSYVVIIHTDGLENASREWTNEKLRELIKQKEAAGNWTFAFFGCDIDAWSQARDMGMSAGSASRYAAPDMQAMYRAKARVSNVMRGQRRMRTDHYAAAASAAAQGASDDELERIVREGDGPNK
jgi:hypothetical protein